MVSVHVVEVKAEHAPLQPMKSPLVPVAGVAVSVSDVPDCTFATHPGPSDAVQ